jgi:hypothetical protein
MIIFELDTGGGDRCCGLTTGYGSVRPPAYQMTFAEVSS